MSLERVALTWEQIDHHTLSVLAGKRSDSRAAGFARRHGRLAQVEIEALDPDDLKAYFEACHSRVVRHDTVGERDGTGTLRPGLPRKSGGGIPTMIEGHQLLAVEALSGIFTAERRVQEAKWELDDRLAAANSAGHTQDDLVS